MHTLEAIIQRRSVRSYTSQQISESDLEKILEAGIHAPSGMNRQAVHITALHNPTKIHTLEEAIQKDFLKINESVSGYQVNLCYHAPTFIIVSASADSIAPELDSAAALENMLLAATSLGISSCWINLLVGKDHLPTIRSVLSSFGVPPQNKVYCCAGFGYSDHLTKERILKPDLYNIVR